MENLRQLHNANRIKKPGIVDIAQKYLAFLSGYIETGQVSETFTLADSIGRIMDLTTDERRVFSGVFERKLLSQMWNPIPFGRRQQQEKYQQEKDAFLQGHKTSMVLWDWNREVTDGWVDALGKAAEDIADYFYGQSFNADAVSKLFAYHIVQIDTKRPQLIKDFLKKS